jgi:hypothetical protein
VITIFLVLALARSRRGQRVIRATADALAPLIAMIGEALLPIFVELANLAHLIIRKIRTLPHRRARHDR